MLKAPQKSAAPEITAASRDLTDVRFSMRSLLITMAVAAVVLAGFGLFLRQFPADAQARLLAYWAILLGLLVAVFLNNSRRRYSAEQRAGRVRFQLVPHSYFLPRAPRVAAILAGVTLLAIAPMMWVFGSFILAWDNTASWGDVINWPAIYGIFTAGLGITYLWWHRRIRLSDNGIVVRHNYLPWDECRRWYWDACYPHVLVLEFEKFNRVAGAVVASEREGVEALLREKVEK